MPAEPTAATLPGAPGGPPGGPAPADADRLERGLDALDAPPAPGGRRGRLARRAGPPVLAALVLLAVWQVVVWLRVKPAYVLPSPADAWAALAAQWDAGLLQESVAGSLRRGAVGFAASVLAGTALGLALARLRWLRVAVGPLVTGLQSLPSVAWVPAAIIWFGLTDAAIYTVVLLGAVPSVANGLLAGMDQVPALYPRVGRVLGARGLGELRWVLLPAALPGYLAGLRQGWAFAWRSLMAAELIAYSPDLGSGLGQLLQTGRELSDMPLVLASILVILLVGIAVELVLFAPVERRMLASRGLVGGPA